MAAKHGDEPNLEDLFREKMIYYSVLRSITNNFSKEREIGRGGFGVVYKGVLRDGFVAVKNFISVIDYKAFRNEVDCLTRIKHQNIVRYLGYCAGAYQHRALTGDKKEIWAHTRHQLICFEYLHKGSLSQHLTYEPCRLEWCVCYKIIQGICLGLQHLHEQKIIHRDIKPDNILLDDGMSPKITDFGLSELLADGKSRIITEENCGTLGYMAPESLGGVFTIKSDIFSLGVVISQIVRGRGKASKEDTELEWSRRLNLDASKKYTPLEQVKACIEISLRCTAHEAVNRPSIQEIVGWLHALTDWSVASDINTSLAPRASKESEVLPGPPLPKLAKVLGDTSPDKSLRPERTASAKCNILSSRSLQITWGETPDYWSWISHPDSRFDECAELLKVYFLAVTGEIPQRELTAGASYQVYLVYRLTRSASGLRGGGAVLTSSLRLYGERIVATSKVSLDPELAPSGAHGVTYPVARSDGWLEVRLAEFANDGGMLGEKAVIVDLREENVAVKKSGLVVECMEFRIDPPNACDVITD